MLTNERIRELMLANGFTIKDGLHDLKPYVYEASRAIEAEVRKDDESLIRQMLEALTAPCAGEKLLALKQTAITAARARLEKAP